MAHFALDIPQCEGDESLLMVAMDAANQPVDESSGDRKGGSAHIAKCFISNNDKQLAMVCYVPRPQPPNVSNIKC